MNVHLSVAIIICPKRRLLEWITPLWQACQRASCISKCSDFTEHFMSVFFHGIFSVATLASQVVLFNRVLPLIPPPKDTTVLTAVSCTLGLDLLAFSHLSSQHWGSLLLLLHSQQSVLLHSCTVLHCMNVPHLFLLSTVGCLWFGDIMSRDAINIHEHVFDWM